MYYSKIKSIKKIGEFKTYDLHTPKYHNFLLDNGILSHNSGKTYSAISICEIMSKLDNVPFTVDHIVFSLTELMELLDSGKLKKGSKIIFDEPQVSISAKDFQSKANRVFNYVVTTFRHMNLSLFFCTPFETLLDKSTRRLFHARFETLSINRTKNTCRLKPRFIEYSDYKAEPYRKQLIVNYKKDGCNHSEKLFYWDVGKPNEDIIKLYEQKKLDFTNRLNKNILQTLKKHDASGKSITAEPVADRKPLTESQEEVMQLLAEGNTIKDVAKLLGISTQNVYLRRNYAIKKGYNVQEFK